MIEDILKKIEADFANTDEAILILESIDDDLKNDRFLRAAVFLARGDKDRLLKIVSMDYRDVLWQAENPDDPEIRKYDFGKSFSELGLL